MILKTYEMFGFRETRIALSTRPEKRVGSDVLWDQAEASLKAALDRMGHPYTLNPGDGAFYGPKIDFRAADALKRLHQLGTIQLDFNLPERFQLEYIDRDNTPKRPVMVHRAVLGSVERFMGLLIEHTAGILPFWLTPVQARVISIKDSHIDYVKNFAGFLRQNGVRVETDLRNESMGLKTREAQIAKIPFALVAGDREMEARTFAVRKYGEKASVVLSQEEILAEFQRLNQIPHTVAQGLGLKR
jgi:threonyl-tRNA synthetase